MHNECCLHTDMCMHVRQTCAQMHNIYNYVAFALEFDCPVVGAFEVTVVIDSSTIACSLLYACL